jgi:predicted amidohydrolase
LAKTFGIHLQAAIKWQKISAGDWAAYAADIATGARPAEERDDDVMTERIRIAAAQPPVSHAPAASGEAVRHLMLRARNEGARLVQFPEGAICGYAAEPMADDPEAVRRQAGLTARLAGELGLWVTVGAVHYLTPPHWPPNSLYVISDGGELAGRYDKGMRSHTELTRRHSPGFEPLVLEVDGFRFGCALCIEINFPEIFLDYRERNVGCILFSSFSEDPVFEILARGDQAPDPSRSR